MIEKYVNQYKLAGLTSGKYDAVINGEIVRNLESTPVLVTAEADLSALSKYNPGTIAYTAGFAAMWQLSAAGTWVSVT